MVITKKIAIDGALVSAATAAGLTLYHDWSSLTEVDCFNSYKSYFNKDIIIEQKSVPGGADADLMNCLRDFSVAVNAFMFYTGANDSQRDTYLQWVNNDTPILGWGVGGENEHVAQTSQDSVGTVPSDWCINLALYFAIPVPANDLRIRNHVTMRDITWQNKQYGCFILSDGDNIQWTSRGFNTDTNFWASSNRGSFNMGWGCNHQILSESVPTAQEYQVRTATNLLGDGLKGSGSGTRDGFYIDLGNMYIFPDIYGTNDGGVPNASLTTQANRIGNTMKNFGLNVVCPIIMNSVSYSNMAYFSPYANSYSRILGIFVKTYPGNYRGNANNVYWITNSWGDSIPVEYVDRSLWQNCDTVSGVTNALNNGSTDPAVKEAYTLINCHPWSLGTMSNILTIVNGLNTNVCIVTPEEYLMIMRLRMKSSNTLNKYLSRINAKLNELDNLTAPTSAASTAKANARNQYNTSLAYYNTSDWQNCFNNSKEADRLTEVSRLSYLKINNGNITGTNLTINSLSKPTTSMYYFDTTEIDPLVLPVKQYRLQISALQNFFYDIS